MNLRKLARRLHLWSSLSIGAFLVLLSLSGAALVYYVEIDRFLHPALDVSSQSPDWDRALSTLRTVYPDKTGPWRFEVTEDKGAIPARYYNPIEKQGQGFAPMMVWLSPDGTQILRRDYWGDYLATWFYNLHFQLLMGKTGEVIVGYLGLCSVLVLLTGLMSWWPKVGQWRKGLSFKRRSAMIGRLYDWHKIIGLIFLLPLLLLSLTGTMLALPDETKAILNLFSKVEKPSATAVLNIKPSVTPSVAASTALLAIPNARLAWIETPPKVGGGYRMRLQVEGDPSHRFPQSYVYVDAGTGEVTSVFDITRQGASNKILNWLHPLHDGSVFGSFGRVLWLLTGVSCLLLFVLGLWRYVLRHRGRRLKPSRAMSRA
ncbi:PepSY-associated TM helix domain-containing protein [Shewanella acanthi]|uniref:PepSY-associated TM helix domain-containing protein n=1 Tax=Shewanella acanthi TaxID=2864212 RepID=UPI001C6624EB|nr:PepSY-associated TM helix domain-containing protein [Shewanella acanthi]QYJ79309.1 PepSY domain-containing protein [Shewanella acanthi]